MWDERYSSKEFVYGTLPNDFLESRGGELQGPVLCLASGEGRNAVWLAEQGLDVYCVDSSAEGVKKTLQLAASRSVVIHAEVADLASFELGENHWGAIVAIFAHLPPPIRARIHEAIPKALRPGGTLLMEMYTPRQLEFRTGGPPSLSMLYTEELVRRDLSELSFEVLREVEREVHEGKFHTGRAAVLQVVAKRVRSKASAVHGR